MPQSGFWTKSEAFAQSPLDSRTPAIAVAVEQPHLAWSRAGQLLHSYRVGDEWTAPQRVAYGAQPSLAAAKDGSLHCVYANEFAGNAEIFYVHWDGKHWSLPELVSRTSGASSDPVGVLDDGGCLHLAWSDVTPGYPTVYYGRRDGRFFTSEPVPHARGSRPSLALVPGGLCMAWQDQHPKTGLYDVYYAERVNGAWAPPLAISDSPDAHSFMPSVAAGREGGRFVAWEEEIDGLFAIYFAEQLGDGWTIPCAVSLSSDQDCRLPRLLVGSGGFLQLFWLEGNTLRHRARPHDAGAPWWQPETIASNGSEIEEMAAAVTPVGRAHLLWNSMERGGPAQLNYAQRSPVLTHSVYLPGYFR
jgi:hypothetical protein